MKHGNRLSHGVTLATPLLGLLALWHVLTGAEIFPPQVLVSPVTVLKAFGDLLRSGELQHQVSESLFRLGAGFGAGALAGILVGLPMALSRLVERMVGPLFHAIRQVPVIAFIPMLVLLFGVDDLFKIVVVALATFFPVTLALFDGTRGIPKSHFEVAALFRLPVPALIFRIILPAIVPALLTGLRLGLTRAWLVLVVAELLAADDGLGQMMEMGRQLFRIDVVMVGVVVTGAIGFTLDRCAKLVEQRLTRWRTA